MYTGNGNNYVYALDAATGNIKWQHKVDGDVTTSVSVIDIGDAAHYSGDSGSQH